MVLSGVIVSVVVPEQGGSECGGAEFAKFPRRLRLVPGADAGMRPRNFELDIYYTALLSILLPVDPFYILFLGILDYISNCFFFLKKIYQNYDNRSLGHKVTTNIIYSTV